jgi:hypothetical protein
MRRRAFLRVAGAAGATGLAGCLGGLPAGQSGPPVEPLPPRAESDPAGADLTDRVGTYDQRDDGPLGGLLPSLGRGPAPHKLVVVNATDGAREVRVVLWGADHGTLLDRRETFPPGGYLTGVLTEADDYTLAAVAEDVAGRASVDAFDCNSRTTRVSLREDRVGAATRGTTALCGL